MARCCYADEYADLFSAWGARRHARRFTRKGLRGTASELADAVTALGVERASVLEVGGGVGDLQAHLLRAGAASVTNVELSPSWEPSAERLLTEVGLADRATRRIGDFVEIADDLAPADVVVLHRVLCCYPDWRGMLGAAMAKAERVVAFTVPVDRWWTRLAIHLGNGLLRVRGCSFRAFVHPPALMIDALESAGYRVSADRQGVVWRTVAAGRHEGTGIGTGD